MESSGSSSTMDAQESPQIDRSAEERMLLAWMGLNNSQRNEGTDRANGTGYSAICSALDKKWFRLAHQFILEGAGLEIKNEQGDTPLILATKIKEVDIVRALISKNVNVNTLNDKGESALFWAVKGGSVEIAKMLLDAGADKTFTDKFSRNLLIQAITQDMDEMVLFLLSRGVSATQRDMSECTPLFWAVARGKKEYVEAILAQENVDPIIYDRSGNTPLHIAVRINDEDIINMLLRHGASVHVVNGKGETPIITAAIHMSNDAVEPLLEAGAQPHMPGFNTMSASQYAEFHDLKLMTQLFQQHVRPQQHSAKRQRTACHDPSNAAAQL